MSDLMLHHIIQMPLDMAMQSELSRLQFYNVAQEVLNERDVLLKQLNDFRLERENWRAAFSHVCDQRDTLQNRIDHKLNPE